MKSRTTWHNLMNNKK